jgi:hypothetical protein
MDSQAVNSRGERWLPTAETSAAELNLASRSKSFPSCAAQPHDCRLRKAWEMSAKHHYGPYSPQVCCDFWWRPRLHRVRAERHVRLGLSLTSVVDLRLCPAVNWVLVFGRLAVWVGVAGLAPRQR